MLMQNKIHQEHFRELTKMIAVIIVILTVNSCGVCMRRPTVVVRDSTHTEVREEVRYIHDTVLITLPAEHKEVMTRDTSSHLENTFSISDARIDSLGFMHHSLISKGKPVAVPYERRESRLDSIVYVDKVKEVRVPVIREKPLTWWQQTQIKGFRVLLMIIIAFVVFRIVPFIRKVS